MDYSKLSDFDISRRIGNLTDVEWAELEGNYHPLCVWKSGRLEVFDPCNNAADAWPIIQQNLISLKPVSLFVGVKGWLAWRGGDKFCAKAVGNNPLRAAMIVYLMMQESE